MTVVKQTESAAKPFAVFATRHFGYAWACGLLWHLCRWGVAFLGTYLVNDMTGSPRMVQLAGTVLYAPLLLGGVLGGVISDRFDRLVTVRVQLLALIPLTVVIGVLVNSDRLEVWMLYVYMFLVGIGWVTDMTSRRALVFDLVGEARLDSAMAMESLSLSMGMVLGALIGGYAVDAVGIGASYFCIAGFLLLALATLSPVTTPATTRPAASKHPVQDLVEGVRMLRTNRPLVGVLGVTVIANFFLFAYFPIIPVLAEDLDASASLVGLLLAGTGIGMMVGSLIFARLQPRPRGVVYLVGLFAALALVVPFALSSHYGLALALIIGSGIGSGFFGSTQSTLAVAAVPEEARGRALGLLSMAIGGLPVGMYVLGEIAEQIGPSRALAFNALAGIAVLTVWIWRHREVVDMTA
ncbi:MFS transporter [Acidimicrobiales bacterium]|nr:MFS transporter [bacterium]MDB9845223.1 MFS transporter [Acidimicrobiales bacterium]